MLSYKETVDYILGIPKFSKKTTQKNIKYLMERLGNPQDSLKVIHVAGTNGKGSVCAFINSVLMEASYKPGMFTSPHLVKVNERIQINHRMITDDEFTYIFNGIKQEIDQMMQKGYDHPSFFEILFAMSTLYFYEKKVDYAILETGLGGRLDVTNMIKKPEVSVITSISLDHTSVLGNTVEEIAAEKAGIIKTGVPVVYYGEDVRICKVIEDKLEETVNVINHGKKIAKESYKIVKKTNKDIAFYARCSYYDKSVFTVPFVSEYQCANARLAIATLEELNIGISEKQMVNGIKNTKWEGRMEQVLPDVYIDGSHNQGGIREFIRTVNGLEDGRADYLLFSAVKEKDFEQMIKTISQETHFDGIIITAVHSERAVSAQTLAACFIKYCHVPVYVKENSKDAFDLGLYLKGSHNRLFCTGSLYLAGDLKKVLEQKNSELRHIGVERG